MSVYLHVHVSVTLPLCPFTSLFFHISVLVPLCPCTSLSLYLSVFYLNVLLPLW